MFFCFVIEMANVQLIYYLSMGYRGKLLRDEEVEI